MILPREGTELGLFRALVRTAPVARPAAGAGLVLGLVLVWHVPMQRFGQRARSTAAGPPVICMEFS